MAQLVGRLGCGASAAPPSLLSAPRSFPERAPL
ncbi:hypothetical protein VG1_CDS0014 [Arthrobacter phage Cupello]|nr:hypothetical protein VG1_CDS0014 [Arthrobacter phage Cupello]